MSARLPKKVAILLEKSKDSALLGVEIYNKPRTAFKSFGYNDVHCLHGTLSCCF
jgi:hypothetical protein